MENVLLRERHGEIEKLILNREAARQRAERAPARGAADRVRGTGRGSERAPDHRHWPRRHVLRPGGRGEFFVPWIPPAPS